LLKNVIKEYSWGSYSAIPELLGKKPPYRKPQAELWMGAHPSGSSMIKTENGWEGLDGLIKKYPDEILGKICAKKFGGELPFLFKVIAASEPLSIQAHPNRTLAKKGFTRENRQGISPDSFIRNYKDEKHKPELVCALTDFEVLCGFRKIENIILFFNKACPDTLRKTVDILGRKREQSGLKIFVEHLLDLDDRLKRNVLLEAAGNALKYSNDDPAFKWVARLAEIYPGDIGVLAPLYLNLVRLSPGQAVFIRTGLVHSYLQGTAIELMAGSDNVIRGGLTQKHASPGEFLKTARFTGQNINILTPVEKRNESVYTAKAREFALSKITVDGRRKYMSPRRRSAEIILCIEGRPVIADGKNTKLSLKPGKSVFIPASVRNYEIEGRGILFKAKTPL
jgi:mannose-6-phosphate isomerase